jgi:hypothetical protein
VEVGHWENKPNFIGCGNWLWQCVEDQVSFKEAASEHVI